MAYPRFFVCLSSLPRVVRTCSLVALFAAYCGPAAFAQSEPSSDYPRPSLKVVASFSILGDMVAEIGGPQIELSTIVGPDSDAHAFEPAPRHAKALAGAGLLVINGLDFEAWLPRLQQSAGFSGTLLVASAGVETRRLNSQGSHSHIDSDHDHVSDKRVGHEDEHNHNRDHDHAGDHSHSHSHSHGDIDPHAWQTLANGAVYAKNIADGLAAADPANAATYQARAHDYISRMQVLDQEIKAEVAQLPADRRKVITSHDAFAYFGAAYGIQFISATGVASQAEPSARDVAAIIDRAKSEGIAAVFLESVTSPKLVQQIARETGAKVGGNLYSDALASPGQPAATYLGMFRWNADQLLAALK